MDGMDEWIVLYHEVEAAPENDPLAYRCWADDRVHAEEQCLDDASVGTVVWAERTPDPVAAYAAYFQAQELGDVLLDTVPASAHATGGLQP